MPGRDRAERAGVVDEAGRPGEASRLGDRGPEAPDRVGRVEEPPRRADVHRRVEPGQRRELAGEDRLVEGEQHQVQVRVGAEALEQRPQRVGELDRHRDVVTGVRAEPAGGRAVVVAAHPGVQGHHQPVVARHPGHLEQHVPAQRGRLGRRWPRPASAAGRSGRPRPAPAGRCRRRRGCGRPRPRRGR